MPKNNVFSGPLFGPLSRASCVDKAPSSNSCSCLLAHGVKMRRLEVRTRQRSTLIVQQCETHIHILTDCFDTVTLERPNLSRAAIMRIPRPSYLRFVSRRPSGAATTGGTSDHTSTLFAVVPD